MTIEVDVNIACDKWKDHGDDLETRLGFICRHVFNMLGIDSHEVNIDISILLTNDANIQTLNAEYRGKDAPTNVLSFPCDELGQGNLMAMADEIICVSLGDIVLSVETIEKQAKEQKKSFEHHVAHLVVHGLLHLLGYDHEEDGEAKMMEELEVDILARMGVGNPY